MSRILFEDDGDTPGDEAAVFEPASDTIRGGRLLTIAGGALLLDTSRDRPCTAPPAGWSTYTTGSGQISGYSARGALLDTRVTTGSRAGFTLSDTYNAFHARVIVQPVVPVASTSLVRYGVLEFTAGAASVRATLARGVGQDPALLVGTADALLPSALPGSVIAVAATTAGVALEIVRQAERVWVFVGGQLVLTTGHFSSASGTIRLYAEMPAPTPSAARVKAYVRSYTVRSHVRIGDALLEEKTQPGPRRVVGLVPASSAPGGSRDLSVFGLFGSATATAGFEYTLPPPRIVGRTAARTLITVQDTALHDGE